MKNISKTVVFSLFAMAILASCEKEINLSLNSSEPQIVIEASVTNISGEGACKVTISKTVDYFNPSAHIAVRGAEVIVSDNLGNSETLTEIEDGKYISYTVEGVQGRTYSLNIIAEGKTYTAISEMQALIKIDSITSKFNDILFGPYEDEGYLITCHYSSDNPDSFVSLFTKKNNKRGDEIYLVNGLFGFQIEDVFQIGDKAIVELRHINEDVYHYYSTINKISGADKNPFNSGAIPTNPVSNISNGALGCFAVYPTSVKSITITD